MPAPAWLVWTGIRLCLVAVVVMWTVAWCTAPLYDPDIPSDHVVVEMSARRNCACRWMSLCRTRRVRDRVVGERLPGGSAVLRGDEILPSKSWQVRRSTA